jgi:hypothetical protein
MPAFNIRNISTEDENVGYSSEYQDVDNAFRRRRGLEPLVCYGSIKNFLQ